MAGDIQLNYIGENVNEKQSELSFGFSGLSIDYNAIEIRRNSYVKRQFTYRQEHYFIQSRLDYWLSISQVSSIQDNHASERFSPEINNQT